MVASATEIRRLPDAEKRAILLAVPSYGTVKTLKHRGKLRPVIEYARTEQELGAPRYLWTFAGEAFATEDQAETVRAAINRDALHIPLGEAVALYKSKRAKTHEARRVIDAYLAAAPSLVSPRTGRPLKPRTIDSTRRVLKRAEPFFEGMTLTELTQRATLDELRAWFQLPADQGGRGLDSEQEARACFAALRAVVSWHRVRHPDFPAPNWPPMPTAKTARRRNRARAPRVRLTLPQTVAALDALEEGWKPLFWTFFYTQCRLTEGRAVLGCDAQRPLLRICRSAADNTAGCAVVDSPKTDETGRYELPGWLWDLIDTHRRSIDPAAPLFTNPHPEATPGVIGESAIYDAWERAATKAKVPYVPPYQAFKHTQVTALRDAGLPLEDILAQTRLTNAETLEFYDDRADERRGSVVGMIDERVRDIRSRKEQF